MSRPVVSPAGWAVIMGGRPIDMEALSSLRYMLTPGTTTSTSGIALIRSSSARSSGFILGVSPPPPHTLMAPLWK